MKKELRVLLLEDMTLDAELIEHELRRNGLRFRAKQVQTETQFLQALGQHWPDIILSDHGIPAFDGFAALAAARTRCPHIPFIFVTGAHGDEVAVKTLKQGADDYVLKSRLHQLVPAINRALRQAQQRKSSDQRAEEDRAALERSVKERTARLEADYREFQDFAYVIGTDLRAPLRHVESFAELLQKNLADSLEPKNRKCLKTIQEAARQMAKLTDELVAFSRIEQIEMYPLHFSLAEVVKEVLQELHRETENRHLEWTIGKLPEVVADPTLLTQALTHLVSNALKFTRNRNPARIEIGSQTHGQEVIVFVRDNGAGFDPRHMHRLFGVFQRLHKSSQFEGLGTGLAHVRRIVHRHGGRAWAEGAIDGGATFYFSLPLK